MPTKTDVILSKEAEHRADMNRRYQAKFRETHRLIIHDLQMKRDDLQRASLLIAKMGNLALAKKLADAATAIGDL